jgi:Fe-S-cluster-containing dehydrogenase component
MVESGGGKKMEKCDLCFSRRDFHDIPPCIDTCPGKALQLREISQSEKRQVEQTIKSVLLLAKAF